MWTIKRKPGFHKRGIIEYFQFSYFIIHLLLIHLALIHYMLSLIFSSPLPSVW
jgi:hypothetical protein